MNGSSRRELLILRHGKSSWNSEARTDFERPLAGRGRKDAPRMGRWLAGRALLPDLVVSSPARRARETAHGAMEAMDLDPDRLVLDERIYGATVGDLVDVLEEVPDTERRVLLVGHNPGFEDLVLWLAAARPGIPPSGKLMPTCALAHFAMPTAWGDIGPASAPLLAITRPKEIAD